ncbi:hypothetical protein ACFQ8Q_00085 [Streptomyces cyaneofuscatus]|uniref:hypothetical protein n=1 Tax=Streptomyces cyaneofuscatus TaxID=66883 RepID=UPI0036993DA3
MTESCDIAIGVLAGGALHRLVPRTVGHGALPKDFGAAWPLVRTDVRAESDRALGAAAGDQSALHQGGQSEFLVLEPECPDGGIPPEVESPQLGRARNASFGGKAEEDVVAAIRIGVVVSQHDEIALSELPEMTEALGHSLALGPECRPTELWMA